MMRNLSWKGVHQGGLKMLLSMLLGLVVLATVGCGGDGGGHDAGIITEIDLPADLVLNLSCGDVGLVLPPPKGVETCVLQDAENPYRAAVIIEFSDQDPDDLEPPFVNIFDLLKDIPAGPTGAKARFYLWATSLARQPRGDNQWSTARALHEVWSAQVADGAGDPLIQAQAIRAYRSALDNFFIAATFFSTCDFAPCPPNEEFVYPVQIKDLTGKDLVLADPPMLLNLFPGPAPFPASFDAQDTMGTWGYGYEVGDPDDFTDNGTTFKFVP